MLIIKNAKVLTMDKVGMIENGYVCIRDKIIDSVGAMADYSFSEEGHEIVELSGKEWILPGFIDAHCHLGLFNDGLDMEGDDGNEDTDPVTPQLRGIDGIYNGDTCFREAYEGGVALVMTGPGSANVLGGQFALLRTYEKTVEKAVISPCMAQKAAFGENPKRVYGKDNKSPATRMGTAALIRETLYKAEEYDKKWEMYEKKLRENSDEDEMPEKPDFDIQLESLRELIQGKLPMKIHAHRQDDILTAVRICNEFGLTYTLDHCTEGYLIADVLKEEYLLGLKIPGRGTGNRIGKGGKLLGIIVGPIICDRSKPELANLSIRAAAELKKAGLPVAVMTDHPVVPQQYLFLSSALTVRGGTDVLGTVASITIEAARILGVDKEYGSIVSGKVGNIVVFSGDPFDIRSDTLLFVGDGKIHYDPGNLSAISGEQRT